MIALRDMLRGIRHAIKSIESGKYHLNIARTIADFILKNTSQEVSVPENI
jgi:hypothetical protein